MKKWIVQVLLLMFLLNFGIPVWAEAGVGAGIGAGVGVGAGAGAGLSSVNGSDYMVADMIVEKDYKLGPGDQLEVNLIIGDNAFTIENKLIVGPDGKIFFPKVGEINVLGLTVPEAKKVVDQRIKQIYLEKYYLSFRLYQPRQIRIYLTGSEDKPLYLGEKKFIYIYGEVPKSGRFEYIPAKKFSDYISYAGGPTPRANLAMTTITRQKQKYYINGSDVIFNGNIEKDMEIEPGDVINVPAQFIYFTDLGSFSTTIFTILALYNTFVK